MKKLIIAVMLLISTTCFSQITSEYYDENNKLIESKNYDVNVKYNIFNKVLTLSIYDIYATTVNKQYLKVLRVEYGDNDEYTTYYCKTFDNDLVNYTFFFKDNNLVYIQFQSGSSAIQSGEGLNYR